MPYGPSPIVPQQAMAELVTNPLYDSASIATAATQAQFFIGANPNNLALSNVPLNGQLANPKFARVGGLRFVINQNTLGIGAATLQDFGNLLYQGFLQLVIGGLKEYITAPAFMFPAGVGVVNQSDRTTAEATAGTACNGMAIFGSSFKLRHIINLPPLQQFGVRWAMGTGAITLVATQRVWCVLDAELGREVL